MTISIPVRTAGRSWRFILWWTWDSGQLDHDSGTYDIAGDLEHKIEESYLKVSHMWMFRMFHYAVNTLGVMAVIVTALLQFRIWFY